MVLRVGKAARGVKRRKSCAPRDGALASGGTGKERQDKIKGRKGIVFFANYWARDGEKHLTGDHIDLWNKSTLTPSRARYPGIVFGLRIVGTVVMFTTVYVL